MGEKGLEPSRHKTLEPKSSASTNSATSAESQAYIQGVNSLRSNCLLWSQVDNFLEIEKGSKKMKFLLIVDLITSLLKISLSKISPDGLGLKY